MARSGEILVNFHENFRWSARTVFLYTRKAVPSRELYFAFLVSCPPCCESTIHHRENYISIVSTLLSIVPRMLLVLARPIIFVARFCPIWDGSQLASSRGYLLMSGCCREMFSWALAAHCLWFLEMCCHLRREDFSWGRSCHLLLSR